MNERQLPRPLEATEGPEVHVWQPILNDFDDLPPKEDSSVDPVDRDEQIATAYGDVEQAYQDAQGEKDED